MKTSNLRTGLLALCLAMPVSLPAAPAATSSAVVATVSSDQIYCALQDLQNNRVFHSGVFAGDYQLSMDYKLAFEAHVAARWGLLGSQSVTTCLFEASRSEATDAQNRRAANDRSRRYDVIWTRWTR